MNEQTSVEKGELAVWIGRMHSRVRQGEVQLLPLLRKALVENGLYHEGAFTRLASESRRNFLERNRQADEGYRHEVEQLPTYRVRNAPFRQVMLKWKLHIFSSRTRREFFERVDYFGSFLSEIGLPPESILRRTLGETLWHQYAEGPPPEKG